MSQPTSPKDLTQVAQNLRRLEDNGADIREPRSPYLMYLGRKVEQPMSGWKLWVTHYFAPKVKCAIVLSKEVNHFKDLKFNRDWNGECWCLSDGIHWVPRISPTNPLTNPCACYIQYICTTLLKQPHSHVIKVCLSHDSKLISLIG